MVVVRSWDGVVLTPHILTAAVAYDRRTRKSSSGVAINACSR